MQLRSRSLPKTFSCQKIRAVDRHMDRKSFSLLIAFLMQRENHLLMRIVLRKPLLRVGHTCIGSHLASVAAALLRKKRKNLMIHNRVLRTGTCRFIMTKRFSRPCHFCVPIFVIWKIPAATCKRIFSVDVFTNVFRVPRRADCFLFNDCQSLLPSPFDFKQ